MMAGRETVHPADMQMVESSLILFVDNSTWNQNGMAQSTRLDSKLAWYETRVLDAFPLGNFVDPISDVITSAQDWLGK